MSNDMCTRRLRRELKAIKINPMVDPVVYTTPLENDLLEWHYVIEGNKDTPYEGGYYWGKLVFPKQYPLKPPSVMILTPNGRFKTNRRLCLSMSDFHPESWNPMWSVSTIITGLISFMVEGSPTLGSIETSTTEKRKFARHSLDYNVKDAQFKNLFPELVTKHKQLLEERIEREGSKKVEKERFEYQQMNKRSRENEFWQLNGVIATLAGFVALVSIMFALASW